MSDIRFPGVAVYPHVTGDNIMSAPAVNVAALAQQIAELPVQTLVELVAAIVTVDAAQADRFADMLIDAAYDVRQADAVVFPSQPPPGMVIGGPALRLDTPLSASEQFAQNVLRRVADDDCRYQLAWMQ